MYKGLPAEENLYRMIVDISQKTGMKIVDAKIHAVLFLEPQALSLEELTEKTGYSLASVSNTVRQLELFKKVKRIKKPGSKKVYVQGEKNLIRTMHEQFKNAIDAVIKPMQDIMPHTIKELKQAQKNPKISKNKKEELKNKIAWYEDYLEQNQKMGELFVSMEQSFRKLEQEYR